MGYPRSLLCLLLGFMLGALSISLVQPFSPNEAIFSPGAKERMISLIDGAHSSMDMEMYLISSQDALDAIVRAKDRGVAVRVLIERDVMGQDGTEAYAYLASRGVNVRFAPSGFSRMHSKFFIIDGSMVLSGSHNLSEAALRSNREASVLIKDSGTISAFQRIFDEDWRASS